MQQHLPFPVIPAKAGIHSTIWVNNGFPLSRK